MPLIVFLQDQDRQIHDCLNLEFLGEFLLNFRILSACYLEFVLIHSVSVFKIQLKQPFPPFLSLLSMKYCAVVPREAIAYFKDDFRSIPIGTGPFKFKLWVENTKLVFRKNHFYHETNEAGVNLSLA